MRSRVLMISACHSESWLKALQSDDALVLTAADARHTSYGCGRLSELTHFGRAMWDEELRHSPSFVEAFQRAVPRIRQREQEAGKQDGFSNPQMRMGRKAAAARQRLGVALGHAPQAAAAAIAAAGNGAAKMEADPFADADEEDAEANAATPE